MTLKEPDSPSLNPRIYNTGELEAVAEEFLKQFHKPPDSIPVDIELILERDLDISIIEFQSLKRLYGMEAFITLSRRAIRMDPMFMDLDSNERRYRFTVAEEGAHAIIHKDLFKNVKTPEDYLALYDSLDPAIYRLMDKNAKYLASAILMPAHMYEEKANEIFQDEAHDSLPLTTVHLLTIQKLSEVFQVSDWAAGIRFQHLGLDRRLRFS